MLPEAVAARFSGLTGLPGKWMARCPSHEDRSPSLSVGIGQGGKTILNCHAGCPTENVVAAVGLAMSDLMPDPSAPGYPEPRVPKSSPPDAKAYWNKLAQADPEGEAYLTSRGLWPIPGDCVRFASGGRYRIAVRLNDSAGEVVNVHRRPAMSRDQVNGPNFLLMTGARVKGTTYGHLLDSFDADWIVEGLADWLGAMALAERLGACPIGIPGVGNAVAAVEERAELFRNRHVYVSLDNDEEGQQAAAKTVVALRACGAKPILARYPAGFKDLGELIEKRGIGAAGDVMAEVFLAAGEHASDEAAAAVEVEDEPKGDPGEPWPVLKDEALYGLAGEFVRMVEPHTESDRAALLIQLLACFGNAVGRGPHFEVEADRHYANIFAVLVGKTASGKGTSFGHVKRALRVVDEGWVKKNIVGNLASGEGLIHAVRDPIYKDEPNEDGSPSKRICIDQGAEDKRLLVHESEFSSPLVIGKRPGNTLSLLIRQAWESGDLSNTNKNSPERATDAHISIIGHITRDELLQHVDSLGIANGFANRFLWVCVKSSKDLPFGSGFSEVPVGPLYARVGRALQTARSIAAMHRDDGANRLWAEVYSKLKDQPANMVGSVCGRARPQVVRLSLLYALLDGGRVIRREHLLAALALWDYCAESARVIFGDASGDPDADKILAALRAAGSKGLTGADINRLFGGHRNPKQLDASLSRLLGRGLIRFEPLLKGGARYFAC